MRPHFAGEAYVRVGDQIRPASEDQFSQLIATHNSKARTLLKWSGKEVTLTMLRPTAGYGTLHTDVVVEGNHIVKSCNAHYATFRHKPAKDEGWIERSYRLNNIELSFDHRADRLQVYYYETR
jgi:hypothetical protein